ncbi:bifunctional methylenetetrahydrofolate dehydrogenase/methenyltetrahydrofolate cyclohydrolase FolD [Candidatus Ornithobacterium hominis]|uniref:bifunctional methylenetetrahydrofolate dehydrogenase/methenyltetrahydrofolate cyclohydrolase FolD n=1 Tax=Candidatus Ornithobacterium hominis TaxID=2497989 RepID=UPI0024BD39B1|nr:bifunctional methylenetetrahydrofolate dehydrogenase/methenyltetrahydrofolate cyclohydrolase FolD [Candidatus Ornithobacterium hominis]CAI9430195.1 bifunctional methylenetetrahydrofolate dehydrogenase/methenyltetrahydrofolate cyclohydrolase FolD [Candidatus Ornithobacterium hominis]
MKLLDGIKLAKKTKKNIRQKVANYVTEGKRAPHLAAVLVGEDPASNAYVKMKIKDCEEVGFKSTLIKKDADISEKELLEIVHELNENKELDGYIVQLPLPKHINEDKILQAIDPQKDVDGFHPTNVGKMALGLETFLPATPFGVMRLLEDYDIATSGKKCVVLGRSNIVGRPMSILMSQPGKHANSTVTICHSGTKNLEEFTQEADIIISAIGKAHFLTSEMVKEGVIIIDVGINRVYDESKKDYKLVGDVDFENIKSKADYITPVPGGVGPMTRAMLLENTLLAYKRFAQ